MQDLKYCRVATAGEALIDMVLREDGCYQPCLGGAVYNLTRALALQGVETLYLNPLSRDRLGRLLAAGLEAAAVRLAQPEPVAEPTALAMVAVDAAGQPDYAFYREGVADRAVTAQQMTQDCARHAPEIVCTGALALDPRDARAYLPWLVAQRLAGRMVVVDVNMRPSVMGDPDAYRSHVLATIQHAHVIKASDEDLQHLGIAGADPIDQARSLLTMTGANWLALTRGADGASLITRHGDSYHHRESRPLQVVDTVGAGDCFLAGLIVRWLELALPQDWGRAATDAAHAHALLAHAVASASINVQRQGCQPPGIDEVRDWLAPPHAGRP
ncbi:PfkB family carbohydrate kinase [Curvibacter sp. APW13]|uniref:PfkB family carbohydrate kinase n=1 Tax=Curvibacter sp. APW13 TaxID=3077236 RepID=UPI0028DFD91B|nr:PfkB family carbohydrate kinase [Curvibacter sp. APW13]MDT8991001.1 PfkB family carbohydrate kinase [Curvibacter sp. APW13]